VKSTSAYFPSPLGGEGFTPAVRSHNVAKRDVAKPQRGEARRMAGRVRIFSFVIVREGGRSSNPCQSYFAARVYWMPACAGMTVFDAAEG
jgi:hypothetical protein